MHQQHHPLLSASLGTQREIISFHFGEDNKRQVYIQAALHGDELPGMAVAWFLKKRLQALECAGQLKAAFTLVPVANPLALGQHWHGTHLGRFHTLSGQDFNRKFPSLGETLAARLAGSFTQSEYDNKRLIRDAVDLHYRDTIPKTELDAQRFTLMRMASQADLMIDLHCDWEAVPHLYTTPHAWPDIEPFARWLGSEVQLLAQISGGEPFDEACCEPWLTLAERFGDEFPMPRGLLPVTLELRGVRDVCPEQAEQDADAIISALQESGYISGSEPAVSVEVAAPVIGGDELVSATTDGEDVAARVENEAGLSTHEVIEAANEQSVIKERYSEGSVAPSPALKNPPTPLAGCEYIHSPVSGLILHRKSLGAHVRPGEVVAEIIDPVTDQITPLVAEYGGLLYARHWVSFATAGMLVVRLAGENEVRQGELLVI
ncbi:succinylglutamate desuccinylase/aspartoacylase family protein [Mixta mediterraneensis]|uniref:succinylglutamate desuccinylase/aspartoacylase family protein n=1 Tax=Mixta mediterraneensis TaxID=2758443 RepID=UPI001876562D|nr:succinylglutamate desuccinylase/aspartoacylase family protein [Mixta mediterraneensis]MBE5252434.1 succinylglutamate desuccinylase/aspartoacylase family protein [Mixta mediterraneensis]